MDREQKIRDRAYEIWVQEGRPEGREGEHWSQAARELGYDDAPAQDGNELPRIGDGDDANPASMSPANVPPAD
jgi:hypothetical protein